MTTLWLYLRIQAMVFVAGIVGPIFFFAYFAAQPDPSIRWMYWWGLVITFIDVVIALSLTNQALKDRETEQQKRDRARRNGFDRFGD